MTDTTTGAAGQAPSAPQCSCEGEHDGSRRHLRGPGIPDRCGLGSAARACLRMASGLTCCQPYRGARGKKSACAALIIATAGWGGETNITKQLGIFGSPTFLVGTELFWGDDRLEALSWIHKKVAAH